MPWMCSASTRLSVVIAVVIWVVACASAHGDLIRSAPARSYPDIAGDIVGAQTYTYDPATQTGTFQLINAPHLISLGPAVADMVHMRPDEDGTMSQHLKMKLDRNGRLVKSPENVFQIRGTVMIGKETFHGILLEGKPTAFGAEVPETPVSRARTSGPEVFDLNMEITGGHLAKAFGRNAYLRIVPQAGSTFNGQFTADFSSERPLTNLRAARGNCRRRFPSRQRLSRSSRSGPDSWPCDSRDT